MNPLSKTLLAAALTTGLISSADAAYLIDESSALIPVGLNAGDSFQLAFVTSQSTTREDSLGSGSDTHAISFWNAFVNTAADGSSLADIPDINWFAATSTVSTAARDNAAVSADVYRLDGVLVDTAASFWFDTGTNGGMIQNPINVDESGNAGLSVETWGGGKKYVQDGTIGFALGNGTAGANVGRSDRTGDGFLKSWWSDADGGFLKGPSTEAHFYAISEVITVVPEPGSLALMGLGGLCLLRRRRND